MNNCCKITTLSFSHLSDFYRDRRMYSLLAALMYGDISSSYNRKCLICHSAHSADIRGHIKDEVSSLIQ